MSDRFTLLDAAKKFGDRDKAEKWFESIRWPDGPVCPRCGYTNILERKGRRPTPYHCRDCGKAFSVRTDTLMHGTSLGLEKWAMAFYLIATNPRGISSYRLSRDLG